MKQPIDILKEYYGYKAFRPGQEDVIRALLAGDDCLAIMPTGAGKSICFQVPALLQPGITLVISPLISLMKDQVDGLVNQQIPAIYINSTLSMAELRQRQDDLLKGKAKLVYISPERLENDYFRRFVDTLNVSMVIIDEAHCVSQWGHDFRPSYQYIKNWIGTLKVRPAVGAFTATATEKVRQDMNALLGLQRETVFFYGFDRENLYFTVEKPTDKMAYIIHYIMGHPNECGIIYAATRKDVDQIYDALHKKGILIGKYHAGMPDTMRKQSQEAFAYDDVNVIVATNAFGMGIDKSNVRFVIHYQMPKNMESYYQEAGRAGRDGAPAECILLFGGKDVVIQKFLIDLSTESPERKQLQMDRLQDMISYCFTTHCLRRAILQYFGEKTDWQQCHHCSTCDRQENTEEIDGTAPAKAVLRCVMELRERFGMTMVCDVLKGANKAKIRDYKLDQCSSFGGLSMLATKEIRDLSQQYLSDGYLQKSSGQYPLLKLTALGREVLRGERKVMQNVPTDRKALMAEVKTKPANDLFETLRQLRYAIAKEEHIPPFVIFADTTLIDMAHMRPQSIAAMADVKGVGSFKLQKYGDRFLQVITDYTKNQEV